MIDKLLEILLWVAAAFIIACVALGVAFVYLLVALNALKWPIVVLLIKCG